ncbi:MAG: hypothetical protein LBE80_04960 [Deltaproteobacteria bacterium]|jgi:hypothetical protein|nr:hypothetical protein [Deltaproteobacteria bacterium]
MLKIREFEEMNQVTGLLAKTLSGAIGRDIPKDVAMTILAAKKQMESLPEVIEDLNLAFNRYLTLNDAITRMTDLANISANMIDGPNVLAVRQDMEEEFHALARVVAEEAGRQHFENSSLTILNTGSALLAVTILTYLKPVLEKLDHDIRGQKELIIEAIEETMNFLGIVAMSYPEAEGISDIRETLSKVTLPEQVDSPIEYSPTLH